MKNVTQPLQQEYDFADPQAVLHNIGFHCHWHCWYLHCCSYHELHCCYLHCHWTCFQPCCSWSHLGYYKRMNTHLSTAFEPENIMNIIKVDMQLCMNQWFIILLGHIYARLTFNGLIRMRQICLFCILVSLVSVISTSSSWRNLETVTIRIISSDLWKRRQIMPYFHQHVSRVTSLNERSASLSVFLQKCPSVTE